MQALRLSLIRTDGGTQPRQQLNFAVVADYTEAMRDGALFPPITVFYDGAEYWLADGFHRLNAAQELHAAEIIADVRQGTLQDAQWYSYSVNQSHGLRRTNEDKRRAVEAALQHPYAGRYSSREIASHCGVSHMTVQRYRDDICNIVTDSRLVTRNGQTYEMNTANIGKLAAPEPADRMISNVFDRDEWRAQFSRADDTEDTLDPPMELEQVADQFPQELTETDRQLLEEDADTALDSNEWYTPVDFIEAARRVMGSIDIDPASNDTAQEFIRAGQHYTKETNGLAQEWNGNVWLNPPYGDPLPWVEKLLAEFDAGRTLQAVLLVNTANSPQWSRLLWHSLYVVCMLDRRVRFWRPDRMEAKGTAQDQMIWYIGYGVETFRAVFEPFGVIR